MIPKVPKTPPFMQRFLGGLVIFEAVLCGGSYLVWRKLNNSRGEVLCGGRESRQRGLIVDSDGHDFREKTKESAPWMLEWYYKMGEMVNDSYKVIRESDEKVWNYRAAEKHDD